MNGTGQRGVGVAVTELPKPPPPLPNAKATMRLHEYLKVNRQALDTTVSAAAEELMMDGDTDADRRDLARDLYKALKKAIREMLESEPEEGHYSGIHDGVAVTIYRPPVGQDLFGRFAINMGRLTVSGVIPCPSDWPTGRGVLPEIVEDFIGVLQQPRGETQVVTLDERGHADFGGLLAGRSYIVDELPDGDLWLRSLNR